MASSGALVTAYILRIRNRAKRAYARDFVQYAWGMRDKPPVPADLPYMAAQAVRIGDLTAFQFLLAGQQRLLVSQLDDLLRRDTVCAGIDDSSDSGQPRQQQYAGEQAV